MMISRLALVTLLSGVVFLVSVAAGQPMERSEQELSEALSLAIINNNSDEVAELLEQGADPNASPKPRDTPLYSAARRGSLPIMKKLIAAGADVNRRDDSGRIPLHGAAAYPKSEPLALLLEAGAKPDSGALAAACSMGLIENVRLLLRAGARADDGIIPAAGGGHVDVLNFLLANGAKISSAPDHRHTALHSAAGSGRLEMIEFLLAQGADPNARNARGNTPLHGVAQYPNIEAARALLAGGAKPNLVNNDGLTPIRLAAISHHAELYSLLSNANGGVESRNAEDIERLKKQDTRPTAELIAVLTSRNYADREAADRALVIRGESVVPEVRKALDSGAKIEQFFELFGKLGPEAAAVLPRLDRLLTDKKYVFWSFITMESMAPGRFATLPEKTRDQAAETLYAAIVDPATGEMAGFYVELLSRMGDSTVPYILKLLRSDNPGLRAGGAEAAEAATFDSDAIEQELIKLLREDSHTGVRVRAARALYNDHYRSDAARSALLETIRELTLQEYDYERNQLGESVASALSHYGPGIIDELLPFVEQDPEKRWLYIGKAWSRLPPVAAPRLAELLEHPQLRVTYMAVSALQDIGHDVVPELIRRLSPETSSAVQVRAAGVLFSLGGGGRVVRPRPALSRALPALLKLAGDEQAQPEARIAAARAALAIDNDAARKADEVLALLPLLIDVLENGGFRQRGIAAETLGLIGPAARDAVPALERSMERPGPGVDREGLSDFYVQEYAHEALKAIREE